MSLPWNTMNQELAGDKVQKNDIPLPPELVLSKKLLAVLGPFDIANSLFLIKQYNFS